METIPPKSVGAIISDQACQGIVEDALAKLRSQEISDLSAVCLDDTCTYAAALRQSITGLTEKVKALPDGANKQAASSALEILDAQYKAVATVLPKIFEGYADPALRPEQQKIIATLYAAKHQCQQIVKALDVKVEAMKKGVLALAEQANINVCQDKIARLPAYLESLYGIGAEAAAAANRLTILNARYGDIYNEDRDHQRSLRADKGAAWRSANYSAQIDQPRASMIFSDPEDRDGPIDWQSHRHTCDIRWRLTQVCDSRQCAAGGSCSGNSYCLVAGLSNNNTTMCGYDPSPFGFKRFHLEYACGADLTKKKTVKLPGYSTAINLICAPPPSRDPISEKAYFVSPPCPITLPDLAQVPPGPTRSQ